MTGFWSGGEILFSLASDSLGTLVSPYEQAALQGLQIGMCALRKYRVET